MSTGALATAGSDAPLAHLSAAAAFGLWLPSLPPLLPTLMVLPPTAQRPERCGAYVFRSRAALPAVSVVDGRYVVAPAVCLGQLAEDLALLDLVIAIDSALQRHLCSSADVLTAMQPRQRGLPVLRRALELCDGRSESPWETVLRVLLTTCGIPVQPQEVIRDDCGAFLARADLRIVGTRRLAEYDGDTHREVARHQHDLARDKSLARAGWERFGYTAKEILGTPDRVVRDAEEALGWPHDPERLRAWRHLVRESTLSPYGHAMLTRRLQRFSRPLRGRKQPR